MESASGERSFGDAVSSIWKAPEIPLAILSFAFHFVWEFLQVPAYAGMTEQPHWEGIKVCTAATIGDVAFALIAFWTTAVASRFRRWIVTPRAWQIALYLAVGIALTVCFEYYYVEITGRWKYSELMPRVPPLGTGLIPLLQWIVVPSLVASLTGRVVNGATNSATRVLGG